MTKSPDAFRTISEVAEWLGVQAHVLRFWETKFSQVRPVKRAGGRRYYRPSDMALLGGIRRLLHEDGLTIRGVQKILREQGVGHVSSLSPPIAIAREAVAPKKAGAKKRKVKVDAEHAEKTEETTSHQVPPGDANGSEGHHREATLQLPFDFPGSRKDARAPETEREHARGAAMDDDASHHQTRESRDPDDAHPDHSTAALGLPEWSHGPAVPAQSSPAAHAALTLPEKLRAQAARLDRDEIATIVLRARQLRDRLSGKPE